MTSAPHAVHLHGDSLEQAFHRFQRVFNQKPFLKSIYTEWFDFIIAQLKPGKTLEIGAGNGSFKSHYPDVISSDVVKAPWIDIVADATRLPFDDETLANIVMIDVVHHIADPADFFVEAKRVLQARGRIVMVEPYISPFSYVIRKLFHHESIDMKRLCIFDKDGKSAMEGNLAIPTLLFGQGQTRFRDTYTGFRITHVSLGEFVAYPLSGGITKPQLLPGFVLHVIRRLEKLLGFLNPLLASKMFVVLEKED